MNTNRYPHHPEDSKMSVSFYRLTVLKQLHNLRSYIRDGLLSHIQIHQRDNDTIRRLYQHAKDIEEEFSLLGKEPKGDPDYERTKIAMMKEVSDYPEVQQEIQQQFSQMHRLQKVIRILKGMEKHYLDN